MKRSKMLLRLISVCLIAVMLFTACKAPDTGDTGNTENTGNTGNTGNTEGADTLVSDYNSRANVSYNNINGKTVDVFSFYVKTNESQNNPNFPQAVMLYQAIKYKEAHPEKEVYATIASFHFSVALAACLDKDSENYGKMKNLYDADYTDDGYYRIAYLCVEAAKKGINITVIGQIDASAVLVGEDEWKADLSFAEYFNSHLGDAAYVEGKKVSDYMTFRHAKWLSYGDKSATDMMHLKLCSVSNFIDSKGNEHGTAVWMGSINLDGVDYRGINGNNSIQSGMVITNHDEIFRVLYNYVNVMKDWCEQEDALTFRNIASNMATEQIDLINAGKGGEIPTDKQIVYLGSENDKVFKMYTTPFGGAGNTWNTDYNPYCAYIAELEEAANGSDYIEFIWNSPKFKQNFELGETMMQMIASAFEKSANLSNRLHLTLEGIDVDTFSALEAGRNIGHLSLNDFSENTWYHTKDVHLSYVKDGVRHYVTLINTLNLHEGSMYYQSNMFLVIDETAETGNAFYAGYASTLVPSLTFEKIEKKTEEVAQ